MTTLTARELLALVDRPMVTSAVVRATAQAWTPLSSSTTEKRLKELAALGSLVRVRLRTARYRTGVDVWARPGSTDDEIRRATEETSAATSRFGFNANGAPPHGGA